MVDWCEVKTSPRDTLKIKMLTGKGALRHSGEKVLLAMFAPEIIL
jgi:hypothetical protein